jgi:DNA-directed RNA polymerase specialized sigma24 family protein
VTVREHDQLADRFENHRAHLQAVAYRMLGSPAEADDAVKEAWLRLSRADTSDVANLGGWLTTVVARICLDMLRSRTARREQPRVVFAFTITRGKITRIDLLAEPELLHQLDVAFPERCPPAITRRRGHFTLRR